MRRRVFLAGLGLAAAALATTFATSDIANAQLRPGGAARPGTWVLIGNQSVGFHVDRDVVRLPRGDNRFRAIKLRVRNADIHFLDLKVVFGSGEVMDFPVRNLIRKGGETRAIALAGGRARRVYEVQLVYKTIPNFKGRALVEVWGEH